MLLPNIDVFLVSRTLFTTFTKETASNNKDIPLMVNIITTRSNNIGHSPIKGNLPSRLPTSEGKSLILQPKGTSK